MGRHGEEAALEIEPVDEEATALVIFSSGTTGDAKGVMMSHRSVIANIHNLMHITGRLPSELDAHQVFSDPAVREAMVQTVQHPTVGELPLLRSPIRLSANPATIRSAPPLFDQHTDEVLPEFGLQSAHATPVDDQAGSRSGIGMQPVGTWVVLTPPVDQRDTASPLCSIDCLPHVRANASLKKL